MSVEFLGRRVDPVALWSNYVEFPTNWNDGGEEFSPLVRCPNPDHHTEKRHFQVNLHTARVHCFANCGISGSYENAISMIEGVSHRQARKSILKHSVIGKSTARRKRSTRAISVMELEYDRYLPQTALEYLRKRGISESSTAKWELGWDSETLRIAIPAKDGHGRLKFLIKRAVKPNVEPRYLYPKDSEKSHLLFGACHLDLGMVRSSGIILVEGSLDCVMLHQHGFTNTVAILGSKVSEIQAQLIANLRPKTIYTMFDADGAGITATNSVAAKLRQTPIRVCRYPKGKSDPAELTQDEALRMIQRSINFNRFTRLTNPKQHRKEIAING